VTAKTAGSDALIPLGVVTGAHGVKGTLRVKLYNPQSGLLAERRDKPVRMVGPETQPVRSRVVLEVGTGPAGVLLVKLEGCGDRDAALALRGAELCVPRSELPALAPGELYFCDLVGLQVRDRAGMAVGRIEAVLDYPAASVLQVATGDAILEVPLREPYFVEAQLEAGLVVLDRLEDLEPLPPAKKRRD
jgi:16S rRNA processing protein RimM